jgi:hypothetical protein
VKRLHKAEVEDTNSTPFIDHDVVGLQIEVEQAFDMKRHEALSQLEKYLTQERVKVVGLYLMAQDILTQRHSPNSLHRDKASLINRMELVKLYERRMPDTREVSELLLEALVPLGVDTMERLEGDFSPGRLVCCSVDDAHPSMPEKLTNLEGAYRYAH